MTISPWIIVDTPQSPVLPPAQTAHLVLLTHFSVSLIGVHTDREKLTGSSPPDTSMKDTITGSPSTIVYLRELRSS